MACVARVECRWCRKVGFSSEVAAPGKGWRCQWRGWEWEVCGEEEGQGMRVYGAWVQEGVQD